MTSSATPGAPRIRAAAIAAPLAVFAIALAARLVGLHHTPYVDELNHVMAAHSLLANHTLQLDPGGEPYTRARLFTYLIAALFRVFGESLAVARIPAVIAGAALVTALFVWVRSVGGRAAAWIAALLFCFQPESLYLSGLARFYTIQTLCFFVGAVMIYRIATDSTLTRARACALGVGALLLFLLALHFQVITIVGIGAVLAWAIGDWGHSHLAPRSEPRRRRTQMLAAVGIVVVLLAAALIAMRFGAVSRRLEMFTYVDDWAAANRNNVRYYHDLFLDQYATLWTLYPLLAILALYRNPRATIFALVPFVVAFVAHSLAAWKAERYLFSVMPMFFAVAGIGIAEGARLARPALDGALDAIVGASLSARARSIGVTLLVACIAGFALIGNGAVSYAIKILHTSDADWQMAMLYRGEPDWALARSALQPPLDSAGVVISSSELKSLYYLHRVDVLLSVDYLGDPRKPGAEFNFFPKVARPVVSTVESLKQLRACFPTGVLVAEPGQWRSPWSITAKVADFVEATMQPVALPPSTKLHAYRWRTSVPDSTADCADIHAVVHK